MTTSRPARVWAEVTGGDALGRGHQPALSWWLPDGSSVQHAYQVRTDDGFDTGRVESAVQCLSGCRSSTGPAGSPPRRSGCGPTGARASGAIRSRWSRACSGRTTGRLAGSAWRRSPAGRRGPGAPGGSGPASRFTRSVDRGCISLPWGCTRPLLTGSGSVTPSSPPAIPSTGSGCSTRLTTSGRGCGRGVTCSRVLLADGWHRGQVGLPRAADQYGPDVALRAQVEVDGRADHRAGGWWRRPARAGGAAPSHVTGGRPYRRAARGPAAARPGVHGVAFDDAGWQASVPAWSDVAVVRSIAPPVRPGGGDPGARAVPAGAGRGRLRGGLRAELQRVGAAGAARGPAAVTRELTLSHGEWLDRDGDLTTAHLDVDLPVLPERLPLGQVDEVVAAR